LSSNPDAIGALLVIGQLCVRCLPIIVRKSLVILLSLIIVVIAGLVSIEVMTAKPPSLRVGATLKDPRSYFMAQVEANHRGIRRLMAHSVEASDGVFICRTKYRVRPNHTIALRSYTYRFDTNGTLLSISSEMKWCGDF
jgi:hypothetical protein